MMTSRSITLPFLALVAALAGCTQPTTSAGAESDNIAAVAPSTQPAPASAVPHFAGRARRGSDFLVRAALRAPINLSAEQRATIEKLLPASAPGKATFDATRASARAAKLAAAIRSNSFDAMVQPASDKHEARIAARAAAIQTLHDTLTPEQRVALVDGIRAMHANGATGGGWNRGNRTARAARGFGQKGGLIASLNLTAEQKQALETKLQAARGSARPSAHAMNAKLESFASDTFDAKAFVARPRTGNAVRGTNRLAILSSVLTPEQRETLAARIEAGPSRFHVNAQTAPRDAARRAVEQ